MMVNNPTFHKQAKHIAIRWHWVRDLVQNKEIQFDSCHDPEQTADMLTKVLPHAKHKKHAQEMGLASV